MNNIPVYYLEACTYPNLSRCTSVFSECQIESILWVKIPTHIAAEYKVNEVIEVGTNISANWVNEIEQEGGTRPWLTIPSIHLNTLPGQHIYKLMFKSTLTNEVTPLFISYILQTEQFDKPYVYMNKNS